MRVYKSDGTYTEDPGDVEFGWYLSDIVIDEANPNYLRENTLRRKRNKLNRDLEETLDLTEETEIVTIERHEPRIKMCAVESVIESKMEPEGMVEALITKTDQFENIDSKLPSKQQVASLINPCSVESKMLLAVVHYAKYRHLIKNKIVDLGDLKGSSNIKFLINDHKVQEEDLTSEIENYKETSEDNMLSLMIQLILADMNCDVADITNTNHANGTKNGESSDLGNSISDTSSESDHEPQILPKFDLHNQNSEPMSSLNVSDIIDKSIDRICEETYDIHLSIAEIKKSFQIDEIKVNALIHEAQSLGKSLRETKYLEELVHLLNGDLHKISSKKWPFRIFHQTPAELHDENTNLII